MLQVKERLVDLVLSTDQVLEIKNKLNHEIEQGLGKDTHNSASVKCFITYVQDLPNSTGMPICFSPYKLHLFQSKLQVIESSLANISLQN
jgi:hypothetical protein